MRVKRICITCGVTYGCKDDILGYDFTCWVYGHCDCNCPDNGNHTTGVCNDCERERIRRKANEKKASS